MNHEQTFSNPGFERKDLCTNGFPASARFIIKLLERMTEGSLTVTFPNGSSARFGSAEPHGEIVLHNWNVCDAALKTGDIGFGETYIAGDWSTPNLATLMQVMVSNRNQIEAVIYGKWWGKLLYRIKHLLNRNTRKGSRKNIHAHYDIGNAFYTEWLDPTMTYSSALYSGTANPLTPDLDDMQSLSLAQTAKYQRILDELVLPARAKVLEIGFGWGGFAEQAARKELHITGLTLSTEQMRYAQERLASAGLADHADFSLRDYRDMGRNAKGQFDGIVSIEMFEAVGEEYWSGYFECLKRNLKPGGKAVIQTITIAEELFDDYRVSSDFIQQYIFPGGMLPTPSIFQRQAERVGLKVTNTLAFGQDYARTLQAWLRNFYAREREIREQGFNLEFMRTWAFYLAYCIAAFRNANTDVIQFTLKHAE